VPESVEICAADVSPANFPPHHPPNVHFSLASVTSLPSEWSGKFDLINQRLLFGALLSKEWPTALSEMYRVLKPGGTVQLIEMDPRFPVPETPTASQAREIMRKVFDAHGLELGVVVQLAALLHAAGFVDVVSEKKQMPMGKLWGEIGMQGSSSLGGAMRNIATSVARSGAAASEEEYRELVGKIETEWDVHGNQYPGQIAVARKPLTVTS